VRWTSCKEEKVVIKNVFVPLINAVKMKRMTEWARERKEDKKNTKDKAESADEYERTEERDIEVDLIHLAVTRQRIGFLLALLMLQLLSFGL